MKKRTIISLLLIILLVGFVTIYNTYAYNEEEKVMEPSDADYNLIYSISKKSSRQVNILSHEEKYIDITLNNSYDSTVKYGIYYHLINQDTLPNGVNLELAPDSTDTLENIIKPNQTRSISIKITNESDTNVDFIIGALVGFENGKIEDLAKNGEILLK